MPNRQLFTPSPHASYAYDDHIVLAVQFALSSQRTLLVGGPPGSGKTSLGQDVANTLGSRYYQVAISSRTKPADLCYRFDAKRQLADAQTRARLIDVSHYVEPGVLWWAFNRESAARRGVLDNTLPMVQDPASYANREGEHAVVLLDELDSGSPDLANDLLAEVSHFGVAFDFFWDVCGCSTERGCPCKGKRSLWDDLVGRRAGQL